jgi:hypothetical protein
LITLDLQEVDSAGAGSEIRRRFAAEIFLSEPKAALEATAAQDLLGLDAPMKQGDFGIPP